MTEQIIGEGEREKIRKQAKQIIDNFVKALENVKFNEKKTKEKVSGFREEGQGTKRDKEFKELMFKNAPNKNEDNIIAEKKNW